VGAIVAGRSAGCLGGPGGDSAEKTSVLGRYPNGIDRATRARARGAIHPSTEGKGAAFAVGDGAVGWTRALTLGSVRA
jgi:hypothetical protein